MCVQSSKFMNPSGKIYKICIIVYVLQVDCFIIIIKISITYPNYTLVPMRTMETSDIE